MNTAMSSTPAAISDELIERSIAKGVAEVLETMAQAKVTSAGRTIDPPLHSQPENLTGKHLVASVGFVGDLQGIINIHFDNEVAIQLSSSMLGMPPEEVAAQDVLSDATGEMTNMIVGVFKNALGDVGFVCKLTIPTIIYGTDFHVDHALCSARRYIFNFRCRDRPIVTDIIIEIP